MHKCCDCCETMRLQRLAISDYVNETLSLRRKVMRHWNYERELLAKIRHLETINETNEQLVELLRGKVSEL